MVYCRGLGEGKGERGRAKSGNASGQRGRLACAVILSRAGRCSGAQEQLTLTLTQPPRREVRPRARALLWTRTCPRPCFSGPDPYSGPCALSWRAYRVELRASRLDETPGGGGTQPRRGLARPERGLLQLTHRAGVFAPLCASDVMVAFVGLVVRNRRQLVLDRGAYFLLRQLAIFVTLRLS